jgi:hypothetical protein
MSDQPKYQVSFSGDLQQNQVVIGDNNTVQQQIGLAARERLDDRELQTLIGELAAIRELVAAGAPGDLREQALGQVDELQAGTTAADHPEPSRLARVYRWFLHNAPDLAESVSTILLGPLVGKLVGGGAGAMATALGADDTPE